MKDKLFKNCSSTVLDNVQKRTCFNNLFQLTEDTILDNALYYNFAIEIVLNEGNETTGTTAHAVCAPHFIGVKETFITC